MNASVTMTNGPDPLAAALTDYVDPLDEDAPTDDMVVTTRRAIGRVALVASEAAFQFQREGTRREAMSWMFAPRKLFGGACASDACLDRDACLRGVLVHGLSLGLDATPDAVDALTEEGGGDDALDDANAFAVDQCGESAELRLFTATLVSDDGCETIHAFHASLAINHVDIAGRLYCRMGSDTARVHIIEGFDASDPLVQALISPAMAEMLSSVAASPNSPIAAGVDVNVEQRFYSLPG